MGRWFYARDSRPNPRWQDAFFPAQFLAITLIPPAWVFMVFSYTGKRLTRWLRVGYLLIPVLTNIVIWTNPLHHWFYGTPRISLDSARFPVLVPDYQFWFYYVHAASEYVILFTAVILLLHSSMKVAPAYRLQGRLLLFSILLPSITDLLYVLGYSPVRHYNYTTAVFSISGAILVWTLFRFHFLDLLPLARDTIIDNLSDGVLVFDHKGRIVEMNPSARRAFFIEEDVLRLPVNQVCNPHLRLLAGLVSEGPVKTTVEISGPENKHYEVLVSPVRTSQGLQIGWVLTSHDVTEHVNLFRQVQIISNQDSLTGIDNHRYFLEQFKQVVKDLKCNPGASIAVVMMDVDHFKKVNDQYGHNAGNRVLTMVARTITSHLRKNDIFGRLGGEEFGIILSDVSCMDVKSIVERLRVSIENIRASIEGKEIRITASFGIVLSSQLNEAELDVESMLQMADQAMYQAKQAGRNQVIVYPNQVAQLEPQPPFAQ